MQTISLEKQSIQFDKIPNVRELGGYEMADGRTVRHGLLLRGGYLAHATDGDIRRMHETYHVKHVFDFRTETERKYQPDAEIPGAKNTWMPTIDMYTDKKVESFPDHAYRDLANYLLTAAFTDKGKQLARDLYPAMIDNEYTQLQYASFLQQIINTDDGAVYWHCSQGKDRTGLGAAFLLAVLGADKELIIDDFSLSNEAYGQELAMVRQKVAELGGGEEEMEVVQAFIGVNTKYFIDSLGIIDNKYGGMDEYVSNQLMMGPDDIKLLRDRFLE